MVSVRKLKVLKTIKGTLNVETPKKPSMKMKNINKAKASIKGTFGVSTPTKKAFFRKMPKKKR